MIVELLLLVLIGASVFAFVIAPLVMADRTTAGEAAEDETQVEPQPQHGPHLEPERQPEQKQPVHDAP